MDFTLHIQKNKRYNTWYLYITKEQTIKHTLY